MVGKALDLWMINPDAAADYREELVWKLADCPKQPTEREVPAIAGAFNHLLDTYRPQYGKPPPIPDVLEECGRHSDRLIGLHDQIDHLRQTDAAHSYPDEDWD